MDIFSMKNSYGIVKKQISSFSTELSKTSEAMGEKRGIFLKVHDRHDREGTEIANLLEVVQNETDNRTKITSGVDTKLNSGQFHIFEKKIDEKKVTEIIFETTESYFAFTS